MRYDKVCVVQLTVEAGICELNAGHPADSEQEYEAERPEHRRPQADRAAPHGCNPGENFYPGRHCDHHRGEGEVALRVEAYAARVHVMRPDDEADRPDRYDRVH